VGSDPRGHALCGSRLARQPAGNRPRAQGRALLAAGPEWGSTAGGVDTSVQALSTEGYPQFPQAPVYACSVTPIGMEGSGSVVRGGSGSEEGGAD